MSVRLRIGVCRGTSALAGLLALSACASFPPTFPGSSKSPAEFQADVEYCKSFALGNPNYHGMTPVQNYAACVVKRGDSVQTPDGRIFSLETMPDFLPKPPPSPPSVNYGYNSTGGTGHPVPQSSLSRPAPAPQTEEQRETDAKYADKVDAIIQHDAEGWLSNQYDAGSAHNVQVIENHGKPVEMRADYTFNHGQRGWVDINFRPKTPCVEYWDTQGECRPITLSRREQFQKAGRALDQAQARSESQHPQSQDNCSLADWMFAPSLLGGSMAGIYLGSGC